MIKLFKKAKNSAIIQQVCTFAGQTAQSSQQNICPGTFLHWAQSFAAFFSFAQTRIISTSCQQHAILIKKEQSHSCQILYSAIFTISIPWK